ncbi:MAG: NUDIX hydrolase [Candidatus Levybacteria bacterium]|nr:NUDIX hydrolase [Candidatus Levybacteria bacterium]
MSQWKIVSQKPVFKTQLFNIREIVFKNKRGTRKTHHVVERDTTVVVFPLTDQYEVYLISEYRYLLNRVLLEAVAGFVKRGEMPLATAKRELQEETGIDASQLEEITRFDMAASIIKARIHIFIAKGLEFGKKHLDEDEEISLIKIPLSLAMEKVMLGEITDSASIIGIFFLDKLRREKKL